MKKRGILQHDLAHVIATLGHTDSLVIADAGLPIPMGVQRIDLAVTISCHSCKTGTKPARDRHDR